MLFDGVVRILGDPLAWLVVAFVIIIAWLSCCNDKGKGGMYDE